MQKIQNYILITILILGMRCNFYMKVDTIERCVVDSFQKNESVILRIEAKDATQPYELKVSIKDIEYRYYESQKFVVKNELKKNLIYSHLASTEVFVCFQADREMYFKIEIDAKIEIPEDLIKSDDMYEIENNIYKSLQDIVDFNKKNEQNDDLDFEDNIKLNSRLVNLTFIESFLIVFLGIVQYIILKSYIQNKK
jgi:hypothetical protein